jgi:hypothetical protein
MDVGVRIDYEYDRGAARALANQVGTDLVTEFCVETVTYATPSTPVDTGLLRSSNQFEVSPPSGWEVHGLVFNPVSYAPYVHDGTRYMEARPFLVEGATIAAQRTNFLFERT